MASFLDNIEANGYMLEGIFNRTAYSFLIGINLLLLDREREIYAIPSKNRSRKTISDLAIVYHRLTILGALLGFTISLDEHGFHNLWSENTYLALADVYSICIFSMVCFMVYSSIRIAYTASSCKLPQSVKCFFLAIPTVSIISVVSVQAVLRTSTDHTRVYAYFVSWIGLSCVVMSYIQLYCIQMVKSALHKNSELVSKLSRTQLKYTFALIVFEGCMFVEAFYCLADQTDHTLNEKTYTFNSRSLRSVIHLLGLIFFTSNGWLDVKDFRLDHLAPAPSLRSARRVSFDTASVPRVIRPAIPPADYSHKQSCASAYYEGSSDDAEHLYP